jgi:uncharacterized protein YlbG (UPF0298 family)
MKIFLLTFSLLLCISSDTEWELRKNKNNIKVYTKVHSDATAINEFKALTSFQGKKEDIKKVLMDVENMDKWYDKISDVKVLKRISPTSAIYRLTFDFPLVQDRYTTIKATLTTDANNNIFITTAYEKINHTPVAEAIFVNDIQSSWNITGSDGNINIQHIGYMNPAGKLPEWLINSSLTDGPIKTITELKKLASK